ncbi:hypothetical protein GCM10020221_23350 [Streptomyces thioluteus]|uniref:Uncharacterized protein n=1 Tax=Streptomyces thioluteus TaxID=66431 RepID=A0ABN3WSU3_STRTU
MHGEGFAQYGTPRPTTCGTARTTPFPAVATAIHKATIHKLCQSVVTDFPGLGTFSLNVEAGM